VISHFAGTGAVARWYFAHGATADKGTNSKPGQGENCLVRFIIVSWPLARGWPSGAGWLGAWFSAISLTWTSWPFVEGIRGIQHDPVVGVETLQDFESGAVVAADRERLRCVL